MKLNNKAFTLIEMLAAVTLLGILSTIAIVSYTKYQEKVRQEAYEAMEQSAFSAAQNYILDKGLNIPDNPAAMRISISTLVDEGYLNKLEDPEAKGSYCHSNSYIYLTSMPQSGTTLKKDAYFVNINCKNYTSPTKWRYS